MAAQDPPDAEPVDSRSQDRELIKKLIHDYGVATLEADAALYRRILAKRSIGLYRFVYEEACRDERVKESFRQKGINSGDDFLTYSAGHAMDERPKLSRKEIEARAGKAASETRISFLSAREAVLGEPRWGIRAVLEEGEWKLDATNRMKEDFARRLQVSEESKARIREY